MASTRHKRQEDELDAEIEAMEAAVRGEQSAPEDNVQPQVIEDDGQGFEPPEQVVVINSDEDFTKVEADPQAQPPQEQQPEQPKAQSGRRSWKNDFLQLEDRYTKLRQASDQFKFETRAQLATLQEGSLALQEENQKLKDKLIELSKSSPAEIASAFSEEDIAILGESTINSFQTAVNTAVSQAVDPLQSELLALKKQERDRLRGKATANRSDARTIFRSRLGELVPDYMAINSNPQFINWLAGQDAYGGAPRMNFFKQAEKTGDVGRVAQYFVEFKQMVAAPEHMLAEHAAPIGGGGGETPNLQPSPNGEKQFSMAFINKFYQDDIDGRYAGREALRDQLDKEIDAALSRPGGVVA